MIKNGNIYRVIDCFLSFWWIGVSLECFLLALSLALGGFFIVYLYLLVLEARAERENGMGDNMFWWI